DGHGQPRPDAGDQRKAVSRAAARLTSDLIAVVVMPVIVVAVVAAVVVVAVVVVAVVVVVVVVVVVPVVPVVVVVVVAVPVVAVAVVVVVTVMPSVVMPSVGHDRDRMIGRRLLSILRPRRRGEAHDHHDPRQHGEQSAHPLPPCPPALRPGARPIGKCSFVPSVGPALPTPQRTNPS